MKRGKLIVIGLLGLVLAVGLTGCIVSTYPGTEKVIVMNPGESKVFKVSGVNLNTPTTKCFWNINRMYGSSSLVEGTDHVEFTVSPEGEKSNRVIITCSFSKWMQVWVNQTGTMWQWVTIQKKSWYICIPRNTAPVWQGDYYIADSTDVQMLNGYTEITGALVISNSNLKRLSGLENITSVGGYLSINDNPTLTNLSGLENLTSIDGDFNISSNVLLCTSLAKELRDQVLSREGIGGTRSIHDNKTCTTP
jgi:hypothetical protein